MVTACSIRSGSQGDAWADIYDEVSPPVSTQSPIIRALQDIFPSPSRLIEFGVGTGRIAIPLAQSERRLIGLDTSQRMLACLRARMGSAGVRISCIRADFCAVPLNVRADGVICVYNTLNSLLERSQQLSTLKEAARLLGAAGVLVIEQQKIGRAHV